MIDNIAVSLGDRDAFASTVIARILAEGAGDSRAWMRASSEARVRASVNLMGRRSFIDRLAKMVGSLS